MTEGRSGEDPLVLDSDVCPTGVILQDSEARSDAEDILCDRSGSGVLMQHSVGVKLTSPPGVELLVLSWDSLLGFEDALLSVEPTPIVWEEDNSSRRVLSGSTVSSVS